jgi:eukaryotic-like serine/threonine-protein kinase
MSAPESDRFDNYWLGFVAQKLSDYIGPVARVVVKRAAAAADSPDDLLRRVGAEIDDERQRARFLEDAGRDLPAMSPQASAPPQETGTGTRVVRIGRDVLAQAERELSQILGPIAALLVRKYASLAGTKHDLFRMLAQEIDDPTERSRFLLRDR